MENGSVNEQNEVKAAEVEESVKEAANDKETVKEEAKENNSSVAEKKDEKPEDGKNKKTAAIVGGAVGIGAVVIVVALVLITVLVVILVATSKPKVNLNKYLNVEYTGYEGRGTATAYIDYDKLESDYAGKFKIKKRYAEDLADDYGVSKNAVGRVYLRDAIRIIVEPGSNLSTGDEVNITWDVDEDLKKYMRVKFKYKDVKEEANGFEVVQLFDPFDYLDVTFNGVAPDGNISMQNNYSDVKAYDVYFEASPMTGLKNGDIVTVTCKLNMSEDRFADQFGALPSTYTKEYTVEGLKSYITSASEIPTETIEKINAQARDAAVSKLKYHDNWDGDDSVVTNVKYVGNYFLTPKDGSSINGNTLHMVYKVTYQITWKRSGEVVNVDKYIVVTYKNIMELPGEGVFINVMDYNMSYENEYTNGITTYGYKTLDQIFDKFIVNNMEQYNYEINITE